MDTKQIHVFIENNKRKISLNIHPIEKFYTAMPFDFIFLIKKFKNYYLIEKAFANGQEFSTKDYPYFASGSFPKTVVFESEVTDYKIAVDFIKSLPHKKFFN